MVSRQFTASTTGNQAIAYHKGRKGWIIFNNGGSTVFISENQSNITSQGFPLAVGESIDYTEFEGDDPRIPIYAQTTAGTADLRIIETFGLNPLLTPPEARS